MRPSGCKAPGAHPPARPTKNHSLSPSHLLQRGGTLRRRHAVALDRRLARRARGRRRRLGAHRLALERRDTRLQRLHALGQRVQLALVLSCAHARLLSDHAHAPCCEPRRANAATHAKRAPCVRPLRAARSPPRRRRSRRSPPQPAAAAAASPMSSRRALSRCCCQMKGARRPPRSARVSRPAKWRRRFPLRQPGHCAAGRSL
jgi:hypothetical protein